MPGSVAESGLAEGNGDIFILDGNSIVSEAYGKTGL